MNNSNMNNSNKIPQRKKLLTQIADGKQNAETLLAELKKNESGVRYETDEKGRKWKVLYSPTAEFHFPFNDRDKEIG